MWNKYLTSWSFSKSENTFDTEILTFLSKFFQIFSVRAHGECFARFLKTRTRTRLQRSHVWTVLCSLFKVMNRSVLGWEHRTRGNNFVSIEMVYILFPVICNQSGICKRELADFVEASGFPPRRMRKPRTFGQQSSDFEPVRSVSPSHTWESNGIASGVIAVAYSLALLRASSVFGRPPTSKIARHSRASPFPSRRPSGEQSWSGLRATGRVVASTRATGITQRLRLTSLWQSASSPPSGHSSPESSGLTSCDEG